MCENQSIKYKDLDRFEKAVKNLERVLLDIKDYCPSAHIYVTPNEINLMVGYGMCVGNKHEKCGDERPILNCLISSLDCGDW